MRGHRDLERVSIAAVVCALVAALVPWEIVRTYRKASASNDELREFACAEGLTREFKPR